MPNFYFDKYGGLPFLLKCNYINTATLDKNLPLFYRQLLDYFQEQTKFSEYNKNNDLILWNNRRITIERNSVFWKQWFDQGVTFISDLMNSNGKFLTFEEFQNKFEIKANYLHYFQLRPSPRLIRGIFRIRNIRRNVLPKLLEICMETPCWSSPG